MSLYKNVAVKYVNATGNVDFVVVVATKNFQHHHKPSLHTDAHKNVAWQVIRAQSSSQFVYPSASSVAVSYRFGGQLVTSGPFHTEEGKTWRIIQECETDTAILEEGGLSF